MRSYVHSLPKAMNLSSLFGRSAQFGLSWYQLFSFVFFLCILASCAVASDDEEIDEGNSDGLLHVVTRSAGSSRIVYPAYVYAFNSDGKCAASQTLSSSKDPVALSLSPGDYTVVAFSGVGTSYKIPEHPSLDDVILMNSSGISSDAMMMGRAKVHLASGGDSSVNMMLYYAVSSVNIVIQHVPSSVTNVSLQFSPLYSSLSFSGDYGSKDSYAEVICQDEGDGSWSAGPFYVFPGSSSDTSFSITFSEGSENHSYSYISHNYSPEANVPFNVSGNYAGDITVGGSLISGEWNPPVDLDFSFGETPEEGGSGDDKPGDSDPDLSGFPAVGDVWNSGIVCSLDNVSDGNADILLLTLQEWTSLATEIEDLVVNELASGWRFPTDEEARLLHSTFGGAKLSALNKTLSSVGSTLIDPEKRYLCNKSGAIYAFGFKSSSTVAAAGKKVKYNTRLVRTVRYSAKK